MPRCPICRGDVPPRTSNKSFPFCSERCRLVDLGKWLGEEYRLSGRTPEEHEDGLPGAGEGGEGDGGHGGHDA